VSTADHCQGRKWAKERTQEANLGSYLPCAVQGRGTEPGVGGPGHFSKTSGLRFWFLLPLMEAMLGHPTPETVSQDRRNLPANHQLHRIQSEHEQQEDQSNCNVEW